MIRPYKSCTYQETIREVNKVLIREGYAVRKNANIDTTQNFKVCMANLFLGEQSPWIDKYNSDAGVRIDVVGLFYDDCDDVSLNSLLLNKDEYEIATRSILILVDQSIDKALEKIGTLTERLSNVGVFLGKKVIIWLEGYGVGKLGDIHVLISEKFTFEDKAECIICDIDKVIEEHKKDVLWTIYKQKRGWKYLPNRF